MTALLLSFSQVAADVGVPSVGTIMTAFAGVSALALLRVTVQNRDEVRTMKQLLLGVEGEAEPSGLLHGVGRLSADVRGISDRLTAHCSDERQFWDVVRAQRQEVRQEVADAAQAVVGASELRLTQQVDALARRVELLAERRQEPRRGNDHRRGR